MNRSFLQMSLVVGFVLLLGCASRPTARYDDFDRVEVAQWNGNYVAGRYFGKTVLALNPRRETRVISSVTNTSISFQTNLTRVLVTNLIVTLSTNFSSASSTNDNPLPAPQPTAATNAEPSEAAPALADTNAAPTSAETAPPAPLTNTVTLLVAPAAPLTNLTITSGLNVSAVRAQNQLTETAQRVDGQSRSVSVVTNNQTITTQLNEIVTTETNRNVTTITNQIVTASTNVLVLETNLLVRDCFLFTELIAPPDFTLATGESLVLLIDGERFAFAPTNSAAAFTTRRPFVSHLFKVPEELFAKISEAHRVRVRLKGQTSVIERDMPKGAQTRFNLLKN